MNLGARDTPDLMPGGGVATVAEQQSCLTSCLALLAHAGYGTAQARALFAAVYAHSTTDCVEPWAEWAAPDGWSLDRAAERKAIFAERGSAR